MKQLSEVGLIEKKKRGQGKPDIIYVMNFTAVHKEGAKEIVLEEQMEQDYQDKLAYILMHPFRNWFNRKTPAVIGIALTVWAMFVCYYLTYYRNFHPDAEHGVAEWADVPKTAKRLYGKGEEPVTCLSKNITVNAKSLPNMHILILGGSGDGKTTSLLIPNILLANMTNIILDVKGDLLKNYGGYLKEKGIAVKSLNFKDMAQSDQYNPFRYIENYTDMVELITNIQTSVKPPDAQKGDPFWDDGVGLYLQSLFEYEWLQEKEEGRTASMLGILDLVNKETQKTDEEGTTQLQQDMQELQERYGEDYPPVRDYRKLKEGASETVRSIVIMVNAQLRLFEIPEIKRIFEGTDDIDIPSLGLGVDGNPEKKTALFLVMPSGDSSYNLFINMFYTQLFTVLKRIADNRRDGQLPIHVRLWADEYYAGPKPLNCETLLGEIRSRNMSIVPILQDIAQIKTLYPNDKWEIFTGNCATTVFLGSGATAHTTHQWVSDMLEDMTIDSRSESLGHSQGSGNLQMSKAGMKLMTPGQISRMPKNDCILFLKGERPIYDKKNWPFNTEVFKEAEKIAGQNGYKNPVYVSYDERNKKYITTRFESRLNYISKEEFTFFEEKAKEDSSIQTFQIDEEAFLYLNFNETPQPSLRELEKMVKEIQVAEVNEEEEEKELSGKDLKKKEKQENLMMAGTVAFSIVAAVAIFMILPYFLSTLMKPVIPSYHLRTVIEGVVRIGIFIVYILLISRMEDIQRTFMYHGAEHKCINCIEHGLPLTVENVRKSSRQHKRCGTSFLFFVLAISIILLLLIRVESPLMRVVVRIALLPVIAGISYEVLKLAGNSENALVNLLSKPGMAIQMMTTSEPDDDMIEVAIQAVEAVFDWRAYERENFHTS